jgi:hypothetical protein
MKVFCSLTWEDIVRESKYEYVCRLWYVKIARCINGTWPAPLPDLELMEEDDDLGNNLFVGADSSSDSC